MWKRLGHDARLKRVTLLVKGKISPILVTERWARSWSQQSAHRWLEAIHTAVGCHNFPPGLIPFHPKSVTAHRPVPNYTAWWQTLLVQTANRKWRGLSHSTISYYLDWRSRSLTYCTHFQAGFFLQLRSGWQDFNWHSASSGHYEI